MRRLALLFAFSLLALAPISSAYVPHLISVQGRLTDNVGNPITSPTRFVFGMYGSETGGAPAWTETQTLTPNTNGVFSALLGSVSALSLTFSQGYWLGVEVGPAGSSQILSPRQQMGSAAYAIQSEQPWNVTGTNVYTNVGNVGIGTASPGYKLDVQGTAGFNGQITGTTASFTGNYLWVNSESAGRLRVGASWGMPGLYSGDDGAKDLTLGVPSGRKIYFGVSTGDAWIEGGTGNTYLKGNVGIGTAAPGAKLEVVGNVKIADGTQGAGKVLTSDAAGLSSWQAASGGTTPSGPYANRPAFPAVGDMYSSTDTKELLVSFSAGTWTAIPSSGIVLASDQVMATHDAVATFTTGTPTLMKTITFNAPIKGVIRVKYTLGLNVHANGDEHNSWAEIRFNDVPVGSNGRRWSTLVGYSDAVITNDIAVDGPAGSTLKIYGWLTVTPYSYGDIKLLSVRYTKQVDQTPISTTNS